MKKIKNILLIFSSLIFLELASQFIISFYGQKNYSFLLKPFSNYIERYSHNYEIAWDYSKNKMKSGTYLSNQRVEYTINSRGFRGREFEVKKKYKRIIAFGGSTTIGLESKDDETYPSQLEILLNENTDEKYEVINMGFSSKSLNYIKELLFTEAYKYNPDIIIIYSNRNSIMYDGGNISPSFESSKIIKINYFLQNNVMTYNLLFKIYKKFLNLKVNSDYFSTPFGGKGISEKYLTKGYENSLVEIINFAKEKKIEVVLVKQAYYFNPNILLELNDYSIEILIDEYKKDFIKKKYKINDEINFWSVMGSILNKNLEKFKNFDNVKIVDPINDLTQSKENFIDYLHLTPRGNKILARNIFQTLKK